MNRRSTQPLQRFERTGLLAIEPKAFFELFAIPITRDSERIDGVEVIEVSGPLVQRDEIWCDSYEAIRKRFKAACEGDARAIVLRIDSPGGDASGCFETARALRAEATAARKPLYAYVDKACSAAYALASAAELIAIGETCCAGSIGVISSRPDCTAQNTARGLRMAFVVSGQRKLDGNPDAPITEAELAETQRHVDDLALKFFALIGDMRPQLSAAQVAGFDGGVFYGDTAVGAGLADGVATFDQLLAVASGKAAMATAFSLKSDYDTARASLEKVAKGDDANAAAARRALAVMAESAPPGEDEPVEGDEPEEKPDAEGDPAPDAEGDDDKPDAEGDPAPPAAADKAGAPAAGGSATELTLAAKFHRLEARVLADEDARKRRRLIASRPDFGPELRAALAKAPIETVREMVKTLPKGKVAAAPKPPITTVAATRAAGQQNTPAAGGGDAPASSRTAEAIDMDRRMGLTTQRLGSRREGSTLYFGVMDVVSDEPAKPLQKGA